MAERIDKGRPPAGARASRPGKNESGPDPGLCLDCAHARRITSGRGSTFWLCGLAEDDPAFARYPRLPVRTCGGYRPAQSPGESD